MELTTMDRTPKRPNVKQPEKQRYRKPTIVQSSTILKQKKERKEWKWNYERKTKNSKTKESVEFTTCDWRWITGKVSDHLLARQMKLEIPNFYCINTDCCNCTNLLPTDSGHIDDNHAEQIDCSLAVSKIHHCFIRLKLKHHLLRLPIFINCRPALYMVSKLIEE